jgi:hypothetical protein
MSELTQRDSTLINTFYNALIGEAGRYGVPVRSGGFNEERDNDYLLWLVVYRFQVGMEVFELFVNTKMSEDSGNRYGWNRASLF